MATATAAALFDLKCDVYMGSEDIRRQSLNVFRMRLLGARVIEVTSGSKTLKDATNQAMRDWMGSVEHTHYIIGSVVGPHPFPMIVRDFQSMIGQEARQRNVCTPKAGCRITCWRAWAGAATRQEFCALRWRCRRQIDRRGSRWAR